MTDKEKVLITDRKTKAYLTLKTSEIIELMEISQTSKDMLEKNIFNLIVYSYGLGYERGTRHAKKK